MATVNPPQGTKFGRIDVSVFQFVKDSEDADLRSDETTAKGYVTFAPNIDYVVDSEGEIFATPPQPYPIPDDGLLSVELLATNSPNMQPKGWMYHVTIALEGGKTIDGNITVPADTTQKLGLALGAGQQPGVIVADQGGKGDPGPPNTLIIGTVVSGASAGATITGDPPSQTLNLTLPKGDAGPANSLSIGTVKQGAAAAAIRGTSPSQTLDLTLPQGAPGPANTLSIGSVSSGTSPSASITGSSPSQTLNLVLSKGDKGDPGPKGDSAVSPSDVELRGTGSPYGIVTPHAAGTYYTDTAGTTGAWRWIATGTSPSSWVVVYGDTGWRNITPSGWPSDVVLMVRREGSMVRVFSQVAETAPEDVSIPPGFGYSLPAGFTFQYPYEGVPIVALSHRSSRFGSSGILAARPSHGKYFWNSVDSSPFKSGAGEYRTSDPWPSALPGTPA